MLLKNLTHKNSPSLRMYQTVSVYPSPLWTVIMVIALWLLISNGMPTNLPFSWHVDHLRFVPFSRSEILESIPTI